MKGRGKEEMGTKVGYLKAREKMPMQGCWQLQSQAMEAWSVHASGKVEPRHGPLMQAVRLNQPRVWVGQKGAMLVLLR